MRWGLQGATSATGGQEKDRDAWAPAGGVKEEKGCGNQRRAIDAGESEAARLGGG